MRSEKILDMQAVQVFMIVAEERSMSAAAKQCGISQSAVSQCVRQLEETLGVDLLDRRRRPLSLTAFGLALLQHGRQILSDIAILKTRVLEAGHGVKPSLRLGLVDSFASTCGPSFIKAIVAETAQLSIRTGLTPGLSEALANRQVDMVVSSDPLLERADIERFCLFEEMYCVIAPPGYATGPMSREDIRSLAARLPIVRYNPGSQVGIQIDRFLGRHGIKASTHVEMDNADAVTAMVAAGIGWALTTPTCLLQGAGAAGRVSVHRVTGLPLSRSLFLMARREEFSRLLRHALRCGRNIVATELMESCAALHSELARLIIFDKGESRGSDDAQRA